MPFAMSQAALPVFEINLNALSAILDKAEAFATAKKIEPAVLLHSRLSPDMFDLTRQIQVATDGARRGSARLAGVEPPSYEDTETTIAQLKERIAKTIAFLKTLDRKQIDAAADREITFPLGGSQQGPNEGRRLSQPFHAAELLFPLHRRLRDPAALRGGCRQARFPGRDPAQDGLRRQKVAPLKQHGNLRSGLPPGNQSVHTRTGRPCLSLNTPTMMRMKSTSDQIPNPPSVTIWSMPVPILPT